MFFGLLYFCSLVIGLCGVRKKGGCTHVPASPPPPYIEIRDILGLALGGPGKGRYCPPPQPQNENPTSLEGF